MKINPVNKFSQAAFGQQQRALNSDIDAAQRTNSQSFGRQSNRSEDILDLKGRNAKLEGQMQAQKALREQALKSDFKKAALSNAQMFGKQLQENDDVGGAKRRNVEKRKPARSETAGEAEPKVGASERESETEDPIRKLAELRMKRFQESHDTMLELAKTFSEMSAERVKTAAQINQIHADTSQAIAEMQRKSHLQRMISDLNHHKSYLKMLTETDKT